MLMHIQFHRLPEESSPSNCTICVYRRVYFTVCTHETETLADEDEQIESCCVSDRLSQRGGPSVRGQEA